MRKDDFTKLADAQIGSTLHRPFLLVSFNEDTSRNGKPYLHIHLSDGYAEEEAKLFDCSADDLSRMNVSKDMLVDVTLSITEYHGGKSLIIKDIAPTADTTLSVLDFVKSPPVDLDVMFNEICQLVQQAANDYNGTCKPLAELTLRILNDKKQSFMDSSAAVGMHHNLRGGLLYHTYRMVQSADALCNVYTRLDRELLLCGAALHDIGKIWEYDTSITGSAEVTSRGLLFGHLYMGASLIKQYTVKENYNPEKVQLLIHLILSHHGKPEWGAVTRPAVAEAMVLHYVDNIDAKMYMFEDQYESVEPGALSQRVAGLENRVYVPKL